MSALPDETLRKILQQIQNTGQQSSKALAHCKAQIQQKERDKRMLHLTIGEIETIPRTTAAGGEVTMYKGVGKMFMAVPRPIMENQLKSQEKDAADELTSLGKKAKFLEKQLADSQAQLRDIFQGVETQDT